MNLGEHRAQVRPVSLPSSLPEYFVVPSSLADQDLKIFSPSFVGRRMPVSDFCWMSLMLMSTVSIQLSEDSACLLVLVLEPFQRQCSCANGSHQRCAAAEEDRPEVTGKGVGPCN